MKRIIFLLFSVLLLTGCVVDSTGKLVNIIASLPAADATVEVKSTDNDPEAVSIRQTIEALISPTPNKDKIAQSVLQTLEALKPTPTATLNEAQKVEKQVQETVAAYSTELAKIAILQATLTAQAVKPTQPAAPLPTFPSYPTVPPYPTTPPIPCERMSYVSDVTTPDGTNYQPNEGFQKIWRIKNVGSCTWTTGYALIFAGGDQMSAPNGVNLSHNVLPGETIDIGINMKAPPNPGKYKGFWRMRNASGVLYGMGMTGKDAIWVEINVKNSAPPPPPPPQPTLPLPPPPPQPTLPPPIYLIKGCEVTNARIDMWTDGRFTARATLKNTGNTTWDNNRFLLSSSGTSWSDLYDSAYFSLPHSVAPNQSVSIAIDGYNSYKDTSDPRFTTVWSLVDSENNWESYCEFTTAYYEY